MFNMGSTEIRYQLNPLDYIPPLNYVRLVFPLPMLPDVDEELVFEDLQESLHLTFHQEPWLSGKVFRRSLHAPGWRPGQLEIRYFSYSLSGPRPHQLKFHRPDTHCTYTELQNMGFPSGIFREEELLLDAPRLGVVDGAGAEVFLAQANFVPGGLLLALTTNHAATDGSGMLSILKMWTNNFRNLQQNLGGQHAGLAAVSMFTFSERDRDRSIPDHVWQHSKTSTNERNFDNGKADPWLRALVALDYPTDDLTTPPATAPEKPRTMLNRIMFISNTNLTALHDLCSQKGASPSTSGTISLPDAIHAFLWRTQLKARAKAAAERGIQLAPISVFESPVEVREVFGSDFPANYTGNCWLLNTASMPLDELLSPSTTLAHIARVTRQAAAKLSRASVLDAYGLLRDVEDLRTVQGRFVERLDSADFLVSNMIFFPMDSINFGDAYFGNNGVPQAVRVLHGQYAEGVRLGHVLPRNERHGGVEVSVNLFEDEMRWLDEDEEASRYMVGIDM